MAIWAQWSRELTHEYPGGMGNFCKYFGCRRGSADIVGGGDYSSAEQRTEINATLTVCEKEIHFAGDIFAVLFCRM